MSNCCSHNPVPKEPVAIPVASCCSPQTKVVQPSSAQMSCCDDGASNANKIDYLLWGSLILCVALYALHIVEPFLIANPIPNWLHHLGHSVFEMLNTMWWGVLVGLVFVGL